MIYYVMLLHYKDYLIFLNTTINDLIKVNTYLSCFYIQQISYLYIGFDVHRLLVFIL